MSGSVRSGRSGPEFRESEGGINLKVNHSTEGVSEGGGSEIGRECDEER
jgi:hypothetical protein